MEGADQEEMLKAYMAAKQAGGRDISGLELSGGGIGADAGTWQRGQKQSDRRDRGDRGDRGNRSNWGGGRGNQQMYHNMEDENQEIQMTVRNFLEDFAMQVTESRVDDVDDMFVKEYPKVSEAIFRGKHGKNQKMPSLTDALSCLGDNHNVHLLYKELYYRHIFSKMDKAVTVEDRIDAWNNYQQIFERLQKDLTGETSGGHSLLKSMPISWLWELLDEFLYHYTTYCHFKAKTAQAKNKSGNNEQHQAKKDHDYSMVVENKQVFDSGEVFLTLKTLIAETNIDAYLAAMKESGNADGVEILSEQAKFMGYFAKIQQVRFHLMLGEYEPALEVVQQMDFGYANSLYYRSPAAHVSLSYFVAFSLFMSDRFSDCAEVVSKNLQFILKLQRFPPLWEMYQPTGKIQDKMMRILTLAQVFSPDNFYCMPEEQVLGLCMDKYSDDIKILKTWGSKDNPALDADMNSKPYASKLVEWFNIISPRFVTILGPDAAPTDPMEGHRRQWEFFWAKMETQKAVPKVSAVLRMYSKISLAKLTALVCGDGITASEDIMKQLLDIVKAKGTQTVMDKSLTSAKGPLLLPGVPQKCTDVNFRVTESGDVLVEIVKGKKDYNSMYIKEIHNLDKIAKAVIAGA